MRVIVDGMPREIGGIGTLLLNMAEYSSALDERDVVFEFIIPADSEYKNLLEKKEYIFYEVPSLKKITKYYKRVKEIFVGKKYDYIWINNTSKINVILPAIAKKYSEAKMISHVHGVSSEEQGIKRKIFDFLTLLLGKKYESLIDIPFACSEEAARCFYQDLKLKKECIVIKNGIFAKKFIFDENARSMIREELGIEKNDILLGAVGRLTHVKNNAFLIDIVSKLPDRFKCIVLGEGELREELETQIEEQNVKERFKLLGNRKDVNKYLSAMDLLLMPSFNEGMPYSLVEAQAAGLFCLVSDGIAREVDLTGNVFFVNLNERDKWIDLIKKYSACSQNRVLANEKIVKKGFSIENSYDIFRKKLEK